jgi:hypothetical protein
MNSVKKWSILIGVAVAAAVLTGAGVWASSAGSNESTSLPLAGVPGQASILAVQEPENGVLGRGARGNAQAIAERFGVGQEEVIDLHSQGIGFGALVKLYAIASIKGVPATSLINQLPVGPEGEADLDALVASLSDGERAAFDALGLRGMGHLKDRMGMLCPPGQEKQGRC